MVESGPGLHQSVFTRQGPIPVRSDLGGMWRRPLGASMAASGTLSPSPTSGRSALLRKLTDARQRLSTLCAKCSKSPNDSQLHARPRSREPRSPSAGLVRQPRCLADRGDGRRQDGGGRAHRRAKVIGITWPIPGELSDAERPVELNLHPSPSPTTNAIPWMATSSGGKSMSPQGHIASTICESHSCASAKFGRIQVEGKWTTFLTARGIGPIRWRSAFPISVSRQVAGSRRRCIHVHA